MLDVSTLLPEIKAIAQTVGTILLRYYAHPPVSQIKADGTPVSVADYESERVIIDALQRLKPEIPIISEESYGNDHRSWSGESCFWMVDPLDGTSHFLNHNPEFTVNIGLIDDQKPILGVICAPALNLLYAAVHEGRATLTHTDTQEEYALMVRRPPTEGLVVLTSASQAKSAEQLLPKTKFHSHHVASYRSVGSGLKMCYIAAGQADLYPRLAGTWEWDTAASQVILEAAGGHVDVLTGERLAYGKPLFHNPAFIAYGLATQTQEEAG